MILKQYFLRRLNLLGLLVHIYLILLAMSIAYVILYKAQYMYWIDSYTYTFKIYLGIYQVYSIPVIGAPFLLYLSFLQRLFLLIGFDLILASRIPIVILYVSVIITLYRILYELTRERYLSLLFSTMSAFDNLLLLLSTVPYREIFTSLLFFIALHLTVKKLLKPQKLDIAFFLVIFLLAIITRPETLIVLFYPFSLIVTYLFLHHTRYIPSFLKNSLMRNSVATFLFVTFITLFEFFIIVIMVDILFNPIIKIFTRFTYIDRILIFSKPNLLNNTANALFNDLFFIPYFGELRCEIIFALLLLATLIVIFSQKKYAKKIIEYTLLITPFWLIFSITITYYLYSFSPDGSLIIDENLRPRFLLIPRMMIYVSLCISFHVIIVSLNDIAKKTKPINKLKFVIHYKKKSVVINAVFLGLIGCPLINSVINTCITNYQEGTKLVTANSEYMSHYFDAAKYVSERLTTKDLVILPVASVFWTFFPRLYNHTLEYSHFWMLANISLRADNTPQEYSVITKTFMEIIRTNSSIKYIVVDNTDVYQKFLSAEWDLISNFLKKEQVFGPITIYQICHEDY